MKHCYAVANVVSPIVKAERLCTVLWSSGCDMLAISMNRPQKFTFNTYSEQDHIGMFQVYLTPSDLGWEPFVRTWLSGLPDELYGEKAPKRFFACLGQLLGVLCPSSGDERR